MIQKWPDRLQEIMRGQSAWISHGYEYVFYRHGKVAIPLGKDACWDAVLEAIEKDGAKVEGRRWWRSSTLEYVVADQNHIYVFDVTDSGWRPEKESQKSIVLPVEDTSSRGSPAIARTWPCWVRVISHDDFGPTLQTERHFIVVELEAKDEA